jgi:hypothetical protein
VRADEWPKGQMEGQACECLGPAVGGNSSLGEIKLSAGDTWVTQSFPSHGSERNLIMT